MMVIEKKKEGHIPLNISGKTVNCVMREVGDIKVKIEKKLKNMANNIIMKIRDIFLCIHA